MDRSAQTLPDPAARPPQERRRSVRQRLHSPVYASFNGPGTGVVVDLSELIDLNEDGFAVQTGAKLEENRAITLCLELPETKSYIHGSGQVIWSDAAGRSGIRFAALSDGSRQILKEWLLANLLIGSSNHAARSEQRAEQRSKQKSEQKFEQKFEQFALKENSPQSSAAESSLPATVAPAEPASVAESGEGSMLARMQKEFDALSALDSVPEEVRVLGGDADAVFGFIAERALNLTGASGAALAFQSDGKMICRGRAGEISPPLASPVDAQHGLTGECATTGSLVLCDDLENDPRLDPEIGRALGIGSLMAAPIMLEARVVGLLELFFSQPQHFSDAQKTILLRLVEMIPMTCLGQSAAEQTRTLAQLLNKQLLTHQLQTKQFPSEQFLTEQLVTKKKSELLPSPPISAPAASARLQNHASRQHIALEQLNARKTDAAIPRMALSTLSPFSFRALIAGTIIVVAVVVGYLAGPLIEKRMSVQRKHSQEFLNSAQASVSPSSEPKQAKNLADLRKLADSGNADAQWQLGVRYHNGEEVPHDDTRAMLWFLRAAEQGQVTAQATLGAYYWAGRGVPQDLTKAYFWSALAFAQGDENSRSRLEGLASQMTKDQVGAARQQAEIWLHSHAQPKQSD